jgi:hypothetical protein
MIYAGAVEEEDTIIEDETLGEKGIIREILGVRQRK